MVAPAVILLLLFTYIPLLGNVIAFQDYCRSSGSRARRGWAWTTSTTLFADPAFWSAICNTLSDHAAPARLLLPRADRAGPAAQQPAVARRMQAVRAVVVYLPHFISWVIVVALFQQMLGGAGVLNRFLIDTRHLRTLDIMANPDTFKLLADRAGDLEGRRLGHHHLPRRAVQRSTPTSTRPRPSTARARGGGSGTSPCRACARSSCCCSSCGSATSCPSASSRSSCSATRSAPGAAEVLDTFVYFNGVRRRELGHGHRGRPAQGRSSAWSSSWPRTSSPTARRGRDLPAMSAIERPAWMGTPRIGTQSCAASGS